MRSPPVTPQLQRRTAQAAHDPDRVCTTLASLIATDFLREASRHTSTSRAAGIDGGTAQPDAAPLDENVRDVHERRRRGRSQAAPVERVWMAQDDGGQRPMGQPPCAEKLVQRVVAMRLEALDAHDGSAGSEGFRPGRSPHEALHARRERCMHEGIGWIVEAEGRGSFERLDRTRRRDVLRQRVKEGRIMRLSGTWLRAGGREAGVRNHPATGVVQGGTLAPLLAHIVLPQVREAWGAPEVQPRLKGRRCLIRFADDWVIGCELEADARRIMAVLPTRFARDGVTIPPTQTALMAFGKPAGRPGATPRHNPCDLLGLTPSWTTSRRGVWGIKRRTAKKRLRRTQQSLWRWGRAQRQAPLKDQYPMLCLKLRGHVGSSGLQGNCRLREAVLRSAEQAWRYGLSRRSSTRAIGWEQFQLLRET